MNNTKENAINTNELAQLMQSLGTRYLEEYTRGMQRYADFLNNIAKSGCDGPERGAIRSTERQSRYTEFVIAETPKILERLSEAGINYYTTLTDLGMQTLNGFFNQVLQADLLPSDHPPTSDGTERSGLIFHGMREQAATNAFLISNNRDEAIEVTFDIAEIVSQDGKACFKPDAEFTPKQCRLAPHSEQVVQCSLSLSSKFTAGQDYHGSISVVGFPEMSMRFTVQVEEPAKPRTQKSTAKKPTAQKTVRKKPTGKKTASKAPKKKTRR